MKSSEKKKNKEEMEVLSFTENTEAVNYLKQQIELKVEKGFKISKKIEEIEEENSQKKKDFYGSYRSSSKGFFNNLTVEDSNSKKDDEEDNSILAKRNLNFEEEDQEFEDGVQKKLKIMNEEDKDRKSKSDKKKKKGGKKEILSEKKGKKNLKEKISINTAGSQSVKKLSRNLEEELNDSSNEKLRIKTKNKEEESDVLMEIEEEKKTPESKISKKISEIISETRNTPPPLPNFEAIAQFNVIRLENEFLSEEEIKDILTSKPPQFIPNESFKGIYLERKVYKEYIKNSEQIEKNELSAKKSKKSSENRKIYTEYYSLQIDSNIAYLEYGVIEEPSCLKYELHETYSFIEAYCIIHKIKQKSVEIGFEEKSEKLVSSLNGNLINAIKQEKIYYFKHNERILEDIETSFEVFKSQEKANKVMKGVFFDEKNDKKILDNLEESNNKEDIVENEVDLEEENEPKEIIEEKEEVFKDLEAAVNIFEDLGQSEVEIYYDKLSHSNPLFGEFSQIFEEKEELGDFNDIDMEKRIEEMEIYERNIKEGNSNRKNQLIK